MTFNSSGIPAFDATTIDFTSRVCVKACPNIVDKMNYYDQATDANILENKVLDLTTAANWAIVKAHITDGDWGNPPTFTRTIGTDTGVTVLGATAIPGGNYCFMSVDSTISEVEALKEQLDTLINDFMKSLTSGSGGTGSFSQAMSSVMSTMDVIMLGFLGSGVTGFIVLFLYTQKVFIGLVTYIMVGSVMGVLGFGCFIVNGMYLKKIILLQGVDNTCFPTWDVASISTFDISSEVSWQMWFGWPTSAAAVCGGSLFMIQLFCVIR